MSNQQWLQYSIDVYNEEFENNRDRLKEHTMFMDRRTLHSKSYITLIDLSSTDPDIL